MSIPLASGRAHIYIYITSDHGRVTFSFQDLLGGTRGAERREGLPAALREARGGGGGEGPRVPRLGSRARRGAMEEPPSPDFRDKLIESQQKESRDRLVT